MKDNNYGIISKNPTLVTKTKVDYYKRFGGRILKYTYSSGKIILEINANPVDIIVPGDICIISLEDFSTEYTVSSVTYTRPIGYIEIISDELKAEEGTISDVEFFVYKKYEVNNNVIEEKLNNIITEFQGETFTEYTYPNCNIDFHNQDLLMWNTKEKTGILYKESVNIENFSIWGELLTHNNLYEYDTNLIGCKVIVTSGEAVGRQAVVIEKYGNGIRLDTNIEELGVKSTDSLSLNIEPIGILKVYYGTLNGNLVNVFSGFIKPSDIKYNISDSTLECSAKGFYAILEDMFAFKTLELENKVDTIPGIDIVHFDNSNATLFDEGERELSVSLGGEQTITGVSVKEIEDNYPAGMHLIRYKPFYSTKSGTKYYSKLNIDSTGDNEISYEDRDTAPPEWADIQDLDGEVYIYSRENGAIITLEIKAEELPKIACEDILITKQEESYKMSQDKICQLQANFSDMESKNLKFQFSRLIYSSNLFTDNPLDFNEFVTEYNQAKITIFSSTISVLYCALSEKFGGARFAGISNNLGSAINFKIQYSKPYGITPEFWDDLPEENYIDNTEGFTKDGEIIVIPPKSWQKKARVGNPKEGAQFYLRFVLIGETTNIIKVNDIKPINILETKFGEYVYIVADINKIVDEDIQQKMYVVRASDGTYKLKFTETNRLLKDVFRSIIINTEFKYNYSIDTWLNNVSFVDRRNNYIGNPVSPKYNKKVTMINSYTTGIVIGLQNELWLYNFEGFTKLYEVGIRFDLVCCSFSGSDIIILAKERQNPEDCLVNDNYKISTNSIVLCGNIYSKVFIENYIEGQLEGSILDTRIHFRSGSLWFSDMLGDGFCNKLGNIAFGENLGGLSENICIPFKQPFSARINNTSVLPLDNDRYDSVSSHYTGNNSAATSDFDIEQPIALEPGQYAYKETFNAATIYPPETGQIWSGEYSFESRIPHKIGTYGWSDLGNGKILCLIAGDNEKEPNGALNGSYMGYKKPLRVKFSILKFNGYIPGKYEVINKNSLRGVGKVVEVLNGVSELEYVSKNRTYLLHSSKEENNRILYSSLCEGYSNKVPPLSITLVNSRTFVNGSNICFEYYVNNLYANNVTIILDLVSEEDYVIYGVSYSAPSYNYYIMYNENYSMDIFDSFSKLLYNVNTDTLVSLYGTSTIYYRIRAYKNTEQRISRVQYFNIQKNIHYPGVIAPANNVLPQESYIAEFGNIRLPADFTVLKYVGGVYTQQTLPLSVSVNDEIIVKSKTKFGKLLVKTGVSVLENEMFKLYYYKNSTWVEIKNYWEGIDSDIVRADYLTNEVFSTANNEEDSTIKELTFGIISDQQYEMLDTNNSGYFIKIKVYYNILSINEIKADNIVLHSNLNIENKYITDDGFLRYRNNFSVLEFIRTSIGGVEYIFGCVLDKDDICYRLIKVNIYRARIYFSLDNMEIVNTEDIDPELRLTGFTQIEGRIYFATSDTKNKKQSSELFYYDTEDGTITSCGVVKAGFYLCSGITKMQNEQGLLDLVVTVSNGKNSLLYSYSDIFAPKIENIEFGDKKVSEVLKELSNLLGLLIYVDNNGKLEIKKRDFDNTVDFTITSEHIVEIKEIENYSDVYTGATIDWEDSLGTSDTVRIGNTSVSSNVLELSNSFINDSNSAISYGRELLKMFSKFVSTIEVTTYMLLDIELFDTVQLVYKEDETGFNSSTKFVVLSIEYIMQEGLTVYKLLEIK